MQSVPAISERSNQLTKRMKMFNCKTVDRFQVYEEEKKRKKEKADKLRKELELRGFTGQPQINPKSKEMFEDISKVVQWEKRKIIQKQDRLNKIVQIN